MKRIGRKILYTIGPSVPSPSPEAKTAPCHPLSSQEALRLLHKSHEKNHTAGAPSQRHTLDQLGDLIGCRVYAAVDMHAFMCETMDTNIHRIL